MLFVQPCQPVISNTDAIPPVDNYTIFINGSFLEIARCSHIQSVDEGIYTVSVTANNIVGSSEKTTIYFSKHDIYISVLCHISNDEIHSPNILNGRVSSI